MREDLSIDTRILRPDRRSFQSGYCFMLRPKVRGGEIEGGGGNGTIWSIAREGQLTQLLQKSVYLGRLEASDGERSIGRWSFNQVPPASWSSSSGPHVFIITSTSRIVLAVGGICCLLFPFPSAQPASLTMEQFSTVIGRGTR